MAAELADEPLSIGELADEVVLSKFCDPDGPMRRQTSLATPPSMGWLEFDGIDSLPAEAWRTESVHIFQKNWSKF